MSSFGRTTSLCQGYGVSKSGRVWEPPSAITGWGGVRTVRHRQTSNSRIQTDCVCVCVQSLSGVRLFATPWTVACQAPLPMEYSRQGYWSRLPIPTPGDLPNPGIEPTSLASPALAGRFFTTAPPGKPVTFTTFHAKITHTGTQRTTELQLRIHFIGVMRSSPAHLAVSRRGAPSRPRMCADPQSRTLRERVMPPLPTPYCFIAILHDKRTRA